VDGARGVTLARDAVADVNASLTTCQGQSGYAWLPSPRVSLTSCQASSLSSTLTAASGVGGIAAYLTVATGAPGAVVAVIAGALVIYSGLVGLCNSSGRGIVLFSIPPSAVSCHSQRGEQ